VWSLALANIFGAGLCILLSGQIARITTIRFTLVAPFLFMLIAFAAFQSSQSLFDLAMLLGIGLLGIFLRRFEWSRPAFLIGFVLSSQAESFANQAVQIATIRFRNDFWGGMEYIFSPVTIGILILLVVSVVIGLRQGHQILGDSMPPTGAKRAPLIFLLAVTTYVAVAVYDSSTINVMRDKIFPVTVGIVTLIACAALILRMKARPETDVVFADLETGGDDAEAPHGLWATLAWFAFLLGASALVGFILALTVFLLSFLRLRAGVSWTRAVILTAIGIGFLIFLGGTLGRDFPPGLLQEYVKLPWPLT